MDTTDYIIIQKDGGILPFVSGKLPSGRPKFPVYGDLAEAKEDFCNKEDLCIIAIAYSKTGGKDIATLKQSIRRYDFSKVIGSFSYDRKIEEDFYEKLLDYVTLYDFVSHQLPH